MNGLACSKQSGRQPKLIDRTKWKSKRECVAQESERRVMKRNKGAEGKTRETNTSES